MQHSPQKPKPLRPHHGHFSLRGLQATPLGRARVRGRDRKLLLPPSSPPTGLFSYHSQHRRPPLPRPCPASSSLAGFHVKQSHFCVLIGCAEGGSSLSRDQGGVSLSRSPLPSRRACVGPSRGLGAGMLRGEERPPERRGAGEGTGQPELRQPHFLGSRGDHSLPGAVSCAAYRSVRVPLSISSLARCCRTLARRTRAHTAAGRAAARAGRRGSGAPGLSAGQRQRRRARLREELARISAAIAGAR